MGILKYKHDSEGNDIKKKKKKKKKKKACFASPREEFTHTKVLGVDLLKETFSPTLKYDFIEK